MSDVKQHKNKEDLGRCHGTTLKKTQCSRNASGYCPKCYHYECCHQHFEHVCLLDATTATTATKRELVPDAHMCCYKTNGGKICPNKGRFPKTGLCGVHEKPYQKAMFNGSSEEKASANAKLEDARRVRQGSIELEDQQAQPLDESHVDASE